MKSTVLCLLMLSIPSILGNTLDGVVTYKEKQANGVLFIFAKKFDGSMPMPLAVKRIPNPKFPLTFSLSVEDAMIKSIPFEGPFKVIARLTKSGDAMDKSGPEGETTKSLNLGAKGIQINLK
ncbi:MAG: hypothetical protein K9K67_11590 [Bacteriovoracaceae bacterium]|nr:hypothetical protein [Bacteriovoracaceae bacterium]